MKKHVKIDEDSLVWKAHLRNLFDEILVNKDLSIMYQPLRITMSILGAAAKHAAQTNDEVMIGYFCRLSLYTFSDPEHEDFNSETAAYYINKTKN